MSFLKNLIDNVADTSPLNCVLICQELLHSLFCPFSVGKLLCCINFNAPNIYCINFRTARPSMQTKPFTNQVTSFSSLMLFLLTFSFAVDLVALALLSLHFSGVVLLQLKPPFYFNCSLSTCPLFICPSMKQREVGRVLN